MFRPHLNMFIGVWGVPDWNQNESWHKIDYCDVVSDFWLKVHSPILRPIPLAAIYSRSTYYCHLSMASDRPGGNFDAHPRRPADPAAELLQFLLENDCNSS